MFYCICTRTIARIRQLGSLAAKRFIPSLGGGLGRGLRLIGKHLAFSLIELMISLIAISVITAAFTPVISKKIKSGNLTIGDSG
ncbi:prepilin-type N-terminal cleavage/methylation domain-containing protein, partial [bacterium]|nr:prepilin-type N-terminal cleavage/methylation domain-containing protein [bacterium]